MSRMHVGCCITAHGFGHAARTMAVMEALAGQSEIQLTVATQVPEWFLQSSYSRSFNYVQVQTDVGLVQQSPLEQDIPATLEALNDYYPLRSVILESLALSFSGCDMVVCDISPAGILAARQAGIPSVLLENFTWDWIYEGYRHAFPELNRTITYLNEVYLEADYRIQTVPVCERVNCNLIVPPVARPFGMSREQVRRKLNIYDDQQFVLISMGGVLLDQLPMERVLKHQEIVFVISGYSGTKVSAPNIRYLPAETDLFHPDIVRASDAVIGKVGYSTIAEVFHADVPLGYVSRPDFRESGPLASFIREEMRGLEIEPQSFADGTWPDILPQLFNLEGKMENRENGAVKCAEFLLELYESKDDV